MIKAMMLTLSMFYLQFGKQNRIIICGTTRQFSQSQLEDRKFGLDVSEIAYRFGGGGMPPRLAQT